MQEREQEIIDLASSILKNLDKYDEAKIDASFIFRFEPGFYNWVSRIRKIMRALIGQQGDEPLSTEDGNRWVLHLDANLGLQVGIVITGEETEYKFSTIKGGYHCLNPELSSNLDSVFKAAAQIGNIDMEELIRLEQLEWMEANQTSKVISEIHHLGNTYSLLPSTTEEGEYSHNEIRKMWNRLVNWVIWGRLVPEFKWKKTFFSESKTGNGIERTIRLFRAPEGKWEPKAEGGRVRIENGPPPNKRMSKETRVRTWAVYFLSKRGGGVMSESKAVESWNKKISKFSFSQKTYQAERNLLFTKFSKKALI